MLNSKPKRHSSNGRNSRFADDDAPREDSVWSGLNSVLPTYAETPPDAPRARLLRTADDKPTAPKLQDFFPRELRPIDRVITFWDASNTWPKNALSDLCGEGVHEQGATRLAHTEGDRTFALIHHTVIESAEGLLYAVLQVEASPLDSASADVALMLLERSDHAVVLSGGSAEHRELPRRLQDFCRQAAWRGPTLQFISPQDKPSRADRLRKITWPRSLRVQVVDMLPDITPGWLVRTLDRLLDDVEFPRLVRPASLPSSGPLGPAPGLQVNSDELAALPLPEPLSAEALAALPERPLANACEAALGVAALAPGAAGLAVLDVYTQAVLARRGDPQLTEAGVRSALQLWSAQSCDDEESTGEPELLWSSHSLHHIVLPVPAQPGLLLLGLIDRNHGDVQQARWQLTVALHELA